MATTERYSCLLVPPSDALSCLGKTRPKRFIFVYLLGCVQADPHIPPNLVNQRIPSARRTPLSRGYYHDTDRRGYT